MKSQKIRMFLIELGYFGLQSISTGLKLKMSIYCVLQGQGEFTW